MLSPASFWKKNLFSLKNNAILHNRVILYFIFLVSLGNLFYLTVERDITSIVIFLLVGFLTSFFSKNMLIILFVALITSAILKHGVKIRHEGLENMIDEPDDSGTAEEPVGEDDDQDLSNEFYLEKDANKNTRKQKVDEEDDEEVMDEEEKEDVVENYEGEDDTKDSSTKKSTTDTKASSNSKKTKSEDESILSACVRKCLG